MARSGQYRRRFAKGAVLIVVSAASLALTLTLALVGSWSLAEDAGAAVERTPERVCPAPALLGASERAAGSVVTHFLRTAVVRQAGSSQGSSARAACLPRNVTVPGLAYPSYETRFPKRIEAWFQLAPRIRNARRLWEYAGFLHVSSPDARPAAFQFLLELHGRRWLVSSFEVAPGSAEIEMENAPT
jgi:hypothetical protein